MKDPARRASWFLLTLFVLGVPSPAVAADPSSGAALAEPCAGCHGPEGISQMEGMPSLAGQPDQFIQWQLVYFRSGRRKDEAMERLATELNDADIRQLGAYFAALPPPAPLDEADPDPDLTERGTKVAAAHNCGACHTDNYAGQQAVARVAAQREDYLVKSLRDFRSGQRLGGGGGAMSSAAFRLTDEEIAALAHYLARLR